jgi:hypothetical protein
VANFHPTLNQTRIANLPTNHAGARGDLPELSLDPWLKKYLVPGSNSEGLPVRQRGGSVEPLSNLATSIEYDEVKDKSSKPLKDIIAQTYDLQIASTKAFIYRSSKPEDLSNMKCLLSLARKQLVDSKNAFARLDQEAYNAAFCSQKKVTEVFATANRDIPSGQFGSRLNS